ncbi:MAG: hypothetical protein QNJ54_26140 [Prochloraceae cyanobacterium]|nr:hypothetical protein [Prochloraceae cyanobacterium]
MTNVTGVLHILIGTYELLSFRNLSGQASRRGLDLHFPRYKFQDEADQQNFQGVLLALLKQVPLSVEIEALMQHWVYFYERSIGCVGVLKDWLIRALAAALYDKSKVLTLEYLQDHALTLAQCERMAIDATEGEQQVSYAESRREPLWRLLQGGMDSSQIPTSQEKSSSVIAPGIEPVAIEASTTSDSSKSLRRKHSTKARDKKEAAVKEDLNTEKPADLKRSRSKKSQARVETPQTQSSEPEPTPIEPSKEKKRTRRVGQRKPKRDPVG